ncbi:hypothetical protein Ddye_025585 [Dipteronia dyeriana]|uniref:Uncharacterized protein n=1 Tax=Dipteronia dyeriana TaxID=168575 RepID=A0AAD9TKH8_9ROSI|nr:hypothetical protein Ddye_025585 [Dipteronia dyeriana]
MAFLAMLALVLSTMAPVSQLHHQFQKKKFLTTFLSMILATGSTVEKVHAIGHLHINTYVNAILGFPIFSTYLTFHATVNVHWVPTVVVLGLQFHAKNQIMEVKVRWIVQTKSKYL